MHLLFYVLVLISLIGFNILLGYGKKEISKKMHTACSLAIVFLGTLGAFLLKSMIAQKLANPRYDAAFRLHVIQSFDSFFRISIVATVLSILLLLFLLFLYKKYRKESILTLFTVTHMSIVMLAVFYGLFYSYERINKIFDEASYSIALTCSIIAMLYIPLIVKRRMISNKL